MHPLHRDVLHMHPIVAWTDVSETRETPRWGTAARGCIIEQMRDDNRHFLTAISVSLQSFAKLWLDASALRYHRDWWMDSIQAGQSAPGPRRPAHKSKLSLSLHDHTGSRGGNVIRNLPLKRGCVQELRRAQRENTM